MSKESVVVCGTGIAGLSAALGLTKAGFATALLGPYGAVPQRGAGPVSADVYSPRVYALSPASQQFLSRLGVWDRLDASRMTAVEAMQVFGDASGHITLRAWQAAQPALAWIVESSQLEQVLQQAVQVFGIPWHNEKFQQLEAGVVLTDAGQRLKADLLVGADGGQSPVRIAAHIHQTTSPYNEVGLVVHLDTELFHQNTATQWFSSEGILALLPLPDTSRGHQVSMVWAMDSDKANALLALPQAERDAALEAQLQHVAGSALGRLTVRSPVFGFPLVLEKSDMVAPGVALVSDAAHRVHPLAGQGLNLGLGDVEQLIEVLRSKESYRSVGDMRVLQRYRRARAEPVAAMGLATDGLHRLFASQLPPVMLARNLGMQLVDRLPFIKRRLIAGASGRHI